MVGRHGPDAVLQQLVAEGLPQRSVLEREVPLNLQQPLLLGGRQFLLRCKLELAQQGEELGVHAVPRELLHERLRRPSPLCLHVHLHPQPRLLLLALRLVLPHLERQGDRPPPCALAPPPRDTLPQVLVLEELAEARDNHVVHRLVARLEKRQQHPQPSRLVQRELVRPVACHRGPQPVNRREHHRLRLALHRHVLALRVQVGRQHPHSLQLPHHVLVLGASPAEACKDAYRVLPDVQGVEALLPDQREHHGDAPPPQVLLEAGEGCGVEEELEASAAKRFLRLLRHKL
mmetsp:Transcript_35582/g.90935  ORF Transcript_35582/g.90935 Transcript_35582/m.90935 type:complete len:289 (-) Transcript_35582:1272-2138(-)